jgi:hypothetical protein
LEERSVFRRQRVTSASSLSVSGRELVLSSLGGRQFGS